MVTAWVFSVTVTSKPAPGLEVGLLGGTATTPGRLPQALKKSAASIKTNTDLISNVTLSGDFA